MVTSTWVFNRRTPTKYFALKCANCARFWSVFQGASQQKLFAFGTCLEGYFIRVTMKYQKCSFIFFYSLLSIVGLWLFIKVSGGPIPWQSNDLWWSLAPTLHTAQYCNLESAWETTEQHIDHCARNDIGKTSCLMNSKQQEASISLS